MLLTDAKIMGICDVLACGVENRLLLVYEIYVYVIDVDLANTFSAFLQSVCKYVNMIDFTELYTRTGIGKVLSC